MNTPTSFDPSPTASPPLKPNSTYSPLARLHHLADHARATAGILTPTETLELVDIAEHYQSQSTNYKERLDQALWDLDHPTLKYL